jgi:hypothetical protein
MLESEERGGFAAPGTEKRIGLSRSLDVSAYGD